MEAETTTTKPTRRSGPRAPFSLLRAERYMLGLRLVDVAREAGKSANFISTLEANPSIGGPSEVEAVRAAMWRLAAGGRGATP